MGWFIMYVEIIVYRIGVCVWGGCRGRSCRFIFLVCGFSEWVGDEVVDIIGIVSLSEL